MPLYSKTAVELLTLLCTRQVSATDIAKEVLARIEATEPQIDAFLHVGREQALQMAAEVDRKLAAGEEVGPLAGIPVGLKDNICTKGTATTCASRMLQDYVPVYDATVVEKLRKAGAVFCGKTNMDEFAMGSSGENSYFKPTKNPWDITRVSGGSSGGSAAAVAACQIPLSLGSDTGGSVRTPAALCGVVGLKPTYGAVSRYGLVAFASSLEQIGPFARTVEDAALLFDVIAGVDKNRDATSKECGFNKNLATNVKGLKIGLPKEYFGAGVAAEVREAVCKATRQLEDLGAQAVEISLPSTQYALSAYYIISSAEASSNLARFDGVKYGFSTGRELGFDGMVEETRSKGFGAEVKRRILLGTHVLSSGYYDAYYKRAKLLQRRIAQEFAAAFEHCDVMITPTTPFTAFRLGEKINDPPAMYAADACTVPANIAGLPALSLPCGFSIEGLPIGMQLIGPRFSENRLLSVGKCYETAVGGFAVKAVEA